MGWLSQVLNSMRHVCRNNLLTRSSPVVQVELAHILDAMQAWLLLESVHAAHALS